MKITYPERYLTELEKRHIFKSEVPSEQRAACDRLGLDFTQKTYENPMGRRLPRVRKDECQVSMTEQLWEYLEGVRARTPGSWT